MLSTVWFFGIWVPLLPFSLESGSPQNLSQSKTSCGFGVEQMLNVTDVVTLFFNRGGGRKLVNRKQVCARKWSSLAQVLRTS